MRAISLLFHDVYLTDPRESGFASDTADRYKLSICDFEAQLAGVAHVRADAPALITEMTGGLTASAKVGSLPDPTSQHWLDGPLRRTVPAVPHVITVDDGGVSYYTLLADRLESYGWRGHCFVSTDAIGRRGFLTAAQIRELDARGHVVGSHSASHPTRFSACHPARMRHEWAHSRQVLEQMLGHEVTAASLPGGYYSRQAADAAREAGLRVLFTSEPTTVLRDASGIFLVGRFTIRRGHPAATASRLVQRAPWARYGEWARWNAKGLVKPVLGPLYMRVADWALRA